VSRRPPSPVRPPTSRTPWGRRRLPPPPPARATARLRRCLFAKGGRCYPTRRRFRATMRRRLPRARAAATGSASAPTAGALTWPWLVSYRAFSIARALSQLSLYLYIFASSCELSTCTSYRTPRKLPALPWRRLIATVRSCNFLSEDYRVHTTKK
jgi:hypothetical protein